MLSPIPLQRIEGLALLVLAVVVYSTSDQSWWWFALLQLAPDLSMIGYLRDPKLGAAIYNAGHALIWPALLLAVGLPISRPWLIAAGAIWLSHIGMDRAFGYGLKLPDSFKHTHLGTMGRT
jgi:hypothetical protein